MVEMMLKVSTKRAIFFFFFFLQVTTKLIELLIQLFNKLFKLFANLEPTIFILLVVIVAFTLSLCCFLYIQSSQKEPVWYVHCF